MDGGAAMSGVYIGIRPELDIGGDAMLAGLGALRLVSASAARSRARSAAF
jgi:hypothetical protein